MSNPDLQRFYERIFSAGNVRKHRSAAFGYGPSDLQRFKRAGLVPIRKDHDFDLDADGERRQRTNEASMPYKRADELSAIVKQYGIVAVCKFVIERTTSITEHQLTQMIGDYAKAHGSDFVKMFTANDEVGLTLRKAHAVVKSAPFATLEPRVSGGKDAVAVNDPDDALAKLTSLAAELRRSAPELSSAQAFDRIYNDPKHRSLAEMERHQNRPITTMMLNGSTGPRISG